MGKNARRRHLEKQRQKEIEKKQIQVAALENKKQQELLRTPTQERAPTPDAQPTPEGLKLAHGDNIVQHIKGKTPIAFLQEVFDCCSEKMIMEYAPLFGKENYACLLIPRINTADILKYLCHYVVLFRLGNKDCPMEDMKKLAAYLMYLKGLGLRIVYYADDLIFWSNNKAPLMLLQTCDAAIVSNDALRDVLINMVKWHKPIIVVPTHINLPVYDELEKLPSSAFSNRFKVLLTSGGRIGINHAYEICEIVNEDPELSKDIEWIFNCSGVAQFRSVLNKFRNIKKNYIDWLSSTQYYSLTKSVDLIIHPAKPQDLEYMCPPEMQQAWLDCKSEVKYTLAGAATIPIISSPTAAYKTAIKDGETGFIAETAQDFVDKIRLLKNDKELYRKMGKAARADIEARYNIDQRYPLYRDAILGKLDKADTSITIIQPSSERTLFIPPIEGGPRTFYENMKRCLPEVSNKKWEVVQTLDTANAAMAIAFVAADQIIQEKMRRPDLKIIYRLDGLPMNFEGELDPTNLSTMQSLFKYADNLIWQSKHCLKMWKDKNLVPPEINSEERIIHNGVDLEVFSPIGNMYVLPTPRKYNFLNLNWSTFKHKRLDLLQEFIKTQEDNTDIAFYLIGNYISTSQIANVNFWRGFKNVTYLGQMRNQSTEAKKLLASIYRSMTGLIFTSEMEGSPNTVLEALACSCPVIYNVNSDIVPEVLGNACLPLEDFIKIMDSIIRDSIIQQLPDLAKGYSMENCIRKYLEVLES